MVTLAWRHNLDPRGGNLGLTTKLLIQEIIQCKRDVGFPSHLIQLIETLKPTETISYLNSWRIIWQIRATKRKHVTTHRLVSSIFVYITGCLPVLFLCHLSLFIQKDVNLSCPWVFYPCLHKRMFTFPVLLPSDCRICSKKASYISPSLRST